MRKRLLSEGIGPVRHLALALAIALCLPGEALAQTPPSGQAAAGSGQNSPFAFPGASCPPGSVPYKGPESKLVAGGGIVYCVVPKRTVVLSKERTGGKCPTAMKPYTDKNASPDNDVIWCQRDENYKIPPAPKQPAKAERPPPPPPSE